MILIYTTLVTRKFFLRFKQNGRQIIVGEVYWKEGAEATFDKILPQRPVHKIISNAIGRSLPEERAYLESVAERMILFHLKILLLLAHIEQKCS